MDRAELDLKELDHKEPSSSNKPSPAALRRAFNSSPPIEEEEENPLLSFWKENGGESLTMLQKRQVLAWEKAKGREFVQRAMHETLLAGSSRFNYLRKAVENPKWEDKSGSKGVPTGAPNASAYEQTDEYKERLSRWKQMFPDEYDAEEERQIVALAEQIRA